MGIKQARGGEGCFLGSIARGSNTIAAAATRNHRVEPKRRVITRRKTRRSLGGLAFAAAELEQGKGVVSEFFTLSRGLKVETLEKRCATTGDSSKPNLLFLHGSYHGEFEEGGGVRGVIERRRLACLPPSSLLSLFLSLFLDDICLMKMLTRSLFPQQGAGAGLSIISITSTQRVTTRLP
mmetsp:Transcript_11567/g.21688  ORF Transcript_11567/g.21688 Transcript_11567/m.21688 type:complete len:180 (-) Transcript_11567:748-1287(-)